MNVTRLRSRLTEKIGSVLVISTAQPEKHF